MLNLVMLTKQQLQQRYFKDSHLDQLREIGNLMLFPDCDPMTEEEVIRRTKDAEVAITSWDAVPFSERILGETPKLKLVLHAGGSVKPVYTPAVVERGIKIVSANSVLAIGVAESALGMTIVSLKNMWRMTSLMREGGNPWLEERFNVKEMYEVTIGVIGGGATGRHYIKLLEPFGVKVLLYDPTLDAAQAAELGAEKRELDDLLREADAVAIHAPSIPATRHMFNERTLGLMKDDAILINTARGSIIDEEALVTELRKGRLFACLDVTDPEPPAVDHPLRQLPNVVLTGHVAGAVTNGLHRMTQSLIDDLRRYVAGEPMRGEADLSKIDTLA